MGANDETPGTDRCRTPPLLRNLLNEGNPTPSA